MRLHPYHDAAGALYPELDTREVTAEVLAAYLSVSRWTVWQRANRGDFGRSLISTGAELRRVNGRKGHWVFRPATIWRVKGWGRYAQVGFRPLDLEGRVRVYQCDPAHTASVEAQRQHAGGTLPPDVQDLIRTLSGTALGLTALVRRLTPTATTNLDFPLERQS